MHETSKASGSCLCNAVTFTANAIDHGIGACHCGICRKWGGGPLITGEQVFAMFAGEN